MKKGLIITINKAPGTSIACRGGDLWITEPMSDDIHLKEGEEHKISGKGKTVIEAMSSSRLEIL